MGIDPSKKGGMGDDDEMKDVEEVHDHCHDGCCPTEKKEEVNVKKDSPKKPDNKEALNWKEKGASHYKKKELENALECWNKAAEIEPENLLHLSNISAALIEMKKLEEAKEVLTKAENSMLSTNTD